MQGEYEQDETRSDAVDETAYVRIVFCATILPSLSSDSHCQVICANVGQGLTITV